MRKMNAILLSLGVIVVVVGGIGWLACGGWKSVGIHYDDSASSPAQIGEIVVSGKAVALEVRVGAASGVEIERTVRYLNPLQGKPGDTHRIEGSVLYLGGDDATMFSAVEYVVSVPTGVRVTANVETGSLNLSGASKVDAKVSTGSITIVGATGDVTARTDTGAIRLDLAAPANVQATTGTGSVEVTVPAAAYRVQAATKLGELKVGIANDPNAPFSVALQAGTGRVTLAAH